MHDIFCHSIKLQTLRLKRDENCKNSLILKVRYKLPENLLEAELDIFQIVPT